MSPVISNSEKRNNAHSRTRSLRPPTLMIDLLFGALMLFAFQMGYVDEPVFSENIELPSTSADKKSKPREIFILVPVKTNDGRWKYKISGEKLISALEVKKKVKEGKKIPVLIFSKNTSLQVYLEAEQQLRKLGLKPGLATKNKEEN